MSRVLLVDTGFSAEPLHRALTAKGLDVFTIGNRPGDPLAGGSAQYIHEDYADLERVHSVIRRLGIDYVVPGCTDKSYSICAALSKDHHFLGFEDPAAVNQLHDKILFRRLCERLGLSAPKIYRRVEDVLESQRTVMVKPADAYSGKGLSKVEFPTPAALNAAIEKASHASTSGCYLLEDFVSGDLFSFSAFLSEGEVTVAFSVAEFGFVNPFAVDVSHVVVGNPLHSQLKRDVEAIAKTLSLRSGLIHLQYIVNGQDYWIIEATRRCPGDLYALLISKSTGYSYSQAYLAPFIGETPLTTGLNGGDFIVRQTVVGDKDGRLDHVAFETTASLEAWFPLAVTGEWVGGGSDGRVGIAFYKLSNEAAQRELVAAFKDRRGTRVELTGIPYE